MGGDDLFCLFLKPYGNFNKMVLIHIYQVKPRFSPCLFRMSFWGPWSFWYWRKMLGVGYVLLCVEGSIIFISSSRRVLLTRNTERITGVVIRVPPSLPGMRGGLWSFRGCPWELLVASLTICSKSKGLFKREGHKGKGWSPEAVRCGERSCCGVRNHWASASDRKHCWVSNQPADRSSGSLLTLGA